MQKRTESDMLDMRPIKVKLGKKEYEIQTLNNRKSAQWREKLYAALAPIVASFDFSGVDLNANHETVSQLMSAKLTGQLIAYPQKLAELLFAFAPDLPQEEILDNATDEQIGIAFSACAEVGYPFFFHLWATKRALAMPPEKIPGPAPRLQ